MDEYKYEVVVGNIGTVYRSNTRQTGTDELRELSATVWIEDRQSGRGASNAILRWHDHCTDEGNGDL